MLCESHLSDLTTVTLDCFSGVLRSCGASFEVQELEVRTWSRDQPRMFLMVQVVVLILTFLLSAQSLIYHMEGDRTCLRCLMYCMRLMESRTTTHQARDTIMQVMIPDDATGCLSRPIKHITS